MEQKGLELERKSGTLTNKCTPIIRLPRKELQKFTINPAFKKLTNSTICKLFLDWN